MSKGYVTKINGAYRITGTRVSLDSVVYAWHKGLSPESILDDFPALTLERIYGAIAFTSPIKTRLMNISARAKLSTKHYAKSILSN
jgi:uncharacterized protein (DUF433 family)